MQNNEQLLQIVQQAIQGDASALMEVCLPYLRNVLRRRVPEDDVDDVAQDTLLKALGKLSQLHADGRGFKSWLTSMAHHMASDFWRGRYRERTEPMPSFTDEIESCQNTQSPVQDALDTEESTRLYEALEQLSDNKRLVMKLHYLEGMSTEAVAIKLNKNHTTVRRWMHESRKTLRDLLE